MNPRRVRILKEGKQVAGPVVYWMQRDQRVHDNWALIYAQTKALEKNVPLFVVFNLVPTFLDATIRQYGFMLKGLHEVEHELQRYNIPFVLLTGDVGEQIPSFLNNVDASLLVSDFNPLKIVRKWKKSIADKIVIPFHEVDAHNIVPCLVTSNKQEYGAYTIRPKIHRLLPEFLEEFPQLKKMGKSATSFHKNNWVEAKINLKIKFDVPEVGWITPGESAAILELERFIRNKLNKYSKSRNDPTLDAQSGLSPYLHFGQLSAQRIVLATQPFTEYGESQQSFLEELIVRRELSDNFCYYNKNYDSVEGFYQWAKDSLNLHRNDKRDYIYTLKEFEHANTHDELWNAAQSEMIHKGKMHGYIRMYWAKKILEWTGSPQEAMQIAIHLNDKYELDGRDPNGYAGIAWSIGGVHDRAWFEREVFGKIRYMNYNGCKRKFEVEKYITQMNELQIKPIK
jgi:deoxyribodipyrimidine photo-lyase